MTNTLNFGTVTSWTFGFLAFTIGTVNTFWGNDTLFGIFIILLSFVFFPPVTEFIKKWTNLSLPWWSKILVGLFILWASLGVGELFDKVDLMLTDLI